MKMKMSSSQAALVSTSTVQAQAENRRALDDPWLGRNDGPKALKTPSRGSIRGG